LAKQSVKRLTLEDELLAGHALADGETMDQPISENDWLGCSKIERYWVKFKN
jgi:hypothetical protein